MNSHLNRYFAVGIGALWIGTAITSVGQTLCKEGPYVGDWWGAIVFGVTMVALLGIGYNAGVESEQ